MEKIVEIQTKYTYETYKELNKFHMQTRRKFNNLILQVMSSMIIICGIAIFFLNNKFTGILYTILGILFLLFDIYFPTLITKIMKKTNKLTEDTINIYTFYNEYIEIKNEQNSANIKYSLIYDAYETKDYFFIYINKLAAYIINKEKVDNDSIKKVRNILKDNLKDKFHTKFRESKK